MRNIIFNTRFFLASGIIITIWVLSPIWPALIIIGGVLLILVLITILWEYHTLKGIAEELTIQRQVSEKLSLSDYQDIHYTIKSNTPVNILLTDELPYQLQHREPIDEFELDGIEAKKITQILRPTIRGHYDFGNIRAYCSLSNPSLISYMKVAESPSAAMVYPSIIQMKRYALQIFAQTAPMQGVRRIRKIGENDEFEHLRQYRQGDSIKSINWKATSRKGELIVNQYQDTRSQRIYCLIDKGRAMEMPFDGLSLLDYSINTALTISNIIIRKYDKAGLITFSDQVTTSLAAENNKQQLDNIASMLYAQQTSFMETGWEQIYHFLRLKVKQRSIFLLFTNFEHQSDLDRALPYLKAINRNHLLVLISFSNSELESAQEMEITDNLSIYKQTIATDYKYKKWSIIKTLQLHGIQTIYTKPKDLSINVINKYLEIKAKRMK